MYSALGEKLDFLMKLTNTPNSTLARALNFDPSYISRIRSGKRGVPKNQPFIKPASSFFAKSIKEDYQQKTLMEALGFAPFSSYSPEEAERLIAEWLLGSGGERHDSVGRFLASFSYYEPKVPAVPAPRPTPVEKLGTAEYFYGNAGKRKAVEKFLTMLAATGEPQTLLLYSDEDMSWLVENPSFFKKWGVMLQTLLSMGSKIKIIHNINRNIGEMLEAIEGWTLLYFSGAIEPYYCPKVRDGIFSRSMFIAPGQCAVLASNVGSTPGALNILVNDLEAVSALESEYKSFLSICRPLMRIFTAQSIKPLMASFSDFYKESGNIILAHSDPTFLTLPQSALKRLAATPEGNRLSRIFRRSKDSYLQALKDGFSVTEILRLPSPERITGESIALPMSLMITGQTVFLKAEEYLEHIDAVLTLMLENENYRAVISDELSENVNISVRTCFGVILYHSSSPFAVFELSEPNLTASFEEYLIRASGASDSRDQTQKKLLSHKKAVEKLLKGRT